MHLPASHDTVHHDDTLPSITGQHNDTTCCLENYFASGSALLPHMINCACTRLQVTRVSQDAEGRPWFDDAALLKMREMWEAKQQTLDGEKLLSPADAFFKAMKDLQCPVGSAKEHAAVGDCLLWLMNDKKIQLHPDVVLAKTSGKIWDADLFPVYMKTIVDPKGLTREDVAIMFFGAAAIAKRKRPGKTGNDFEMPGFYSESLAGMTREQATGDAIRANANTRRRRLTLKTRATRVPLAESDLLPWQRRAVAMFIHGGHASDRHIWWFWNRRVRAQRMPTPLCATCTANGQNAKQLRLISLVHGVYVFSLPLCSAGARRKICAVCVPHRSQRRPFSNLRRRRSSRQRRVQRHGC